jgi:hypothetical protein
MIALVDAFDDLVVTTSDIPVDGLLLQDEYIGALVEPRSCTRIT